MNPSEEKQLKSLQSEKRQILIEIADRQERLGVIDKLLAALTTQPAEEVPLHP